MMLKKKVLFVCIGNACRSQMAEGYARALGRDVLEPYSAGSKPAGFVAEEAIEAMREEGIDISDHYSKGFADLPVKDFDYIITMACQDTCPYLPAKEQLHWDIPDPIGRGPVFFRQVRDQIKENVLALIEGIRTGG